MKKNLWSEFDGLSPVSVMGRLFAWFVGFIVISYVAMNLWINHLLDLSGLTSLFDGTLRLLGL